MIRVRVTEMVRVRALSQDGGHLKGTGHDHCPTLTQDLASLVPPPVYEPLLEQS